MLVLLALFACRAEEEPVEETDPADLDGDGFGEDDCDNDDDSVHPGAQEERNLVDDDCDGLVDEDLIREGDVLITEVMPDPSAELGEYIELHNVGDEDVDLVGWTLGGATFEEPLILPAGQTLVLGQSRDRDANGGIFVDVLMPELSLGDASGSLALEVGETTVFALDYGADHGLRAGSAIGLDPDYSDGEAEHWCRQRTDLSNGDEGTPNAPNDVCRHLDHDGDGYSWEEGDCDDEDGSVSPAVAERWDWADSDCSGLSDDLSISDVDHAAWTFGYAYPGYGSNLGRGDLDGDGTDEAVIGGYSGVMVVSTSASGGEASEAALAWVTSPYYNYLGAVPPEAADLSGDGADDLVIGGSDYYYAEEGNKALGVWFGPLSGALDATAPDLAFTGSEYTNQLRPTLADLSGDGQAELLVGDTTHGYYAGAVRVFQVDPSAGSIALADHDGALTGAEGYAYDYVGNRLSAADIDGDGAEDLAVAASGVDAPVYNGGAVYLVAGGSLPDGAIAEQAWAAVVGKGDYDALGDGGSPQLADFDGDSKLDLAVPSASSNEVYVFFDAGSLSGTVSAWDADVTLGGGQSPTEFGYGLASGDFDGDGQSDLAVGAPDGTYTYNYYDEEDDPVGVVSMFLGTTLSDSARLGPEDADRTLTGEQPGSYFGQALFSFDFGGDGVDDLMVSDPDLFEVVLVEN
jgi:hypothetical protein